MDTLLQFSEGMPRYEGQHTKYLTPPTILGQTTPIDTLALKEHSTLIYVYQEPTTNETAFHPVQADQHCHRYFIR